MGGIVQCLRWDPSGERLAVSFRDSPVIAIFATSLRPSLSLTPIGLIKGCVDINGGGGCEQEFPNCMEFARKFEQGALLTVVS